ncbi:5-(carboxyamino)imidazole ribonucleotide synthase [Reinekea marinisedimentorum]|uniref:N5-carboxyaminoimidazole ribonucleotide synthase n=1 Tax=Reinekea marinisedimentorum TaxID=230495 RepID=A0A4R3IBJ4_9GAMM|nr:5-(carboxyamino)imidazole ribonucleotide synthase [Reinekea marinisedimentorum]TCS43841.1 5-(carboxyamino)imidazole ribonucleotide synthase [Reinekea marinisedimentorum]
MKLGVVGGGQLGRMLAQAALPLGIETKFLDPSAQSCAAAAGQLICAAYDDAEGIQQLSEGVSAVTFEFENVPPLTVEKLSQSLPAYPPANALATARDRWVEKSMFRDLGIDTPAFEKIDDQETLDAAVERLGCPAVLKTRTLGYDGKGQKVLRSTQDAAGAFAFLGSVPLIMESFVEFEYEVSCIGVRSASGDCVFYPLIHNEHRQGILYRSQPILNSSLQSQAESVVKKVMDSLNYVGTLAFEFFVKDDQLIANEIAPRVHNSGHWTIEGSATSQFENHVRAVAGLPLGSTETRGDVAMYNIIGKLPVIEKILAIPGVHLHNYGKSERAGRKIAHLTVTSESAEQLNSRCSQVEALLVNDLGV